MRRALSCLPLALLLIANVVPSKAQSAETTAAPAAPAPLPAEPEGAPVYYDLNRPSPALTCTLDNPDKLPIVWWKNDTAKITDIPELAGRYTLQPGGAALELTRAHEDDWGTYSCAVGAARQAFRLHARVYTRLPSANTNVVEGQKLKLVCKVVGRPAPPVEWRYNATDGPDPKNNHSFVGELVDAVLGDRVVLGASPANISDAELVLSAAQRSDAGHYACVPLAPPEALANTPMGHTTLRVKDMYAALWPFLGICAEVLVLCAVILVYERRRTKPELDDSDTDNHDQKKS